jgi:Peptidase MA superfamily
MRPFLTTKDTKGTKFFLALLAWALAFGLLNTKQASAQSSIEIESIATYVFGGQITFTAQIKAPVQIQQATIVILDESLGVSHVRPVVFTDGRSELVFATAQNRIRPFATLSWYYQVTLSDGASAQSVRQSMRYEDNRYSWQTLSAGSLRVLWVQGDTAFGQTALNAALTGVQNINGLLPANLNQPIDLYIYPSRNDIALLTGEAWEIGRAYPDLGIALVAVELDSNQSLNLEQRLPHELMHILLYRQLGAGYKKLPVWLNEGFATLAEINPTADYDRVLAEYSDRNELIPMRDLCASFPTDSASAFLAYAQARSFTTYLRDTYGTPALLNLANVYASGVDCETGIQGALGITLTDLDESWREQALGQNVLGAAFRNLLPYLVILLLLIVLPFMFGMNASEQKAQRNGPNSRNR